MRAPPAPPSGVLPAAERLAAVASVLCLHPARQRDALDGWLAATEAVRVAGPDGLAANEAMVFRDGYGRACWRLHLLPDSDFLAWDQVSLALPSRPPPRWPSAARWWRRMRGWRAQVLRLRVVVDHEGRRILVAEAAQLSDVGARHARRIAAAHGARLIAAHACCCLARRDAALAPHS
ncbi:Hemin transport protein [Lysobacter silvisoli]|uniref:Hemin transport protein n=1 Tax=Lysobacter silvisoli TaxID=2293254 RepID=A0A371K696_9GAMM|nr:Hemin transport protein [Lysobacter silvisoli]RDZ29483.1 Hemin transport protein [Lysobacter silvisoli]